MLPSEISNKKVKELLDSQTELLLVDCRQTEEFGEAELEEPLADVVLLGRPGETAELQLRAVVAAVAVLPGGCSAAAAASVRPLLRPARRRTLPPSQCGSGRR